MRRKIIGIAFLILTCAFCFQAFAQGPKKGKKAMGSSSKSIETHLILQPRFQAFDNSKTGVSGSEFYIRVAKLAVKGQVSENVSYFVGLLTNNLGKAGNTEIDVQLSDAWMEYTASEMLKLDVGMMKLPFTRHMQQNVKRIHGMDFHNFFMVNTGAYMHRDIGIMARGLLANRKVDYRVALTNGKPHDNTKTGDKHFRGVARIGYNFFDAEEDLFVAGTYLGKKKILTCGISLDVEPGVGGVNNNSMHKSYAFDAFADIPIDDNGVVANFNYIKMNEGTDRVKGFGVWGDLGYRIQKVEPLVAIEYYKPDKGDKGKRLAILPGINLWLDGYSTNVKAEFGLTKMNDAPKWDKTFLIQTQIAY